MPLPPNHTILTYSPFSSAHHDNDTQDVAAYIKKEFDKKYNPTWHCIVGRNFGSYVTHETKHFIYFYLGELRYEIYARAIWFGLVVAIAVVIISFANAVLHLFCLCRGIFG